MRLVMYKEKKFINVFESALKLRYGKTIEESSTREKYNALAESIMLYVADDWKKTQEDYNKSNQAYYFSVEYLVGRSLKNNLVNLLIHDDIEKDLEKIGIDLNELEEKELDAALGNGGLGRLAACFMESAATKDLPLTGYGLRYSQGILEQHFIDGFQVESGDNWIRYGDPWSLRKDSKAKIVEFSDFKVKAVPYDMPIIGYDTKNINTLRLWQSEAIDGFDFQKFNNFKYDESLSEKNRAEDITRVLYPNDEQRPGKVLRLRQQYFFSSASIQDIIENHLEMYDSLDNLDQKVKIQLNDTHPVIGISELVRILYDDYGYSFSDALNKAENIFSYTNHTVLAEALEVWEESIVRDANPRNLEIIYKINETLIDELNENDVEKEDIDKLAIVKNGYVYMANLGIYLSHKVNGVAGLHTQILKDDVLNHWYRYSPDKFINKTNGVTPRRWLVMSNPELSAFITKYLGHDSWIKDFSKLKKLEDFIEDDDFLREFEEIKHTKKTQLADYIYENEKIEIDPHSIFDIQVKRIHEYKRQLLNAFYIVYLYQKLKDNPNLDIVPRTFIFGGKSAPGYERAKGIIKYINEVAKKVNNDPEIKDKIKVVFVQNYNVSYAEKIFVAADVSEQISTAGKEASGTGNMKFMINGTPTLGTYDGANVEIVEEAGMENNFIFGARVEELNEIRDSYAPMEYYQKDPELRRVVDTLMDGTFKDNDTFMFYNIFNSLIKENGNRGDEYFLLKDFRSLVEAQEKIEKTYKDRRTWLQMSIRNIANSGKFSSDRTIMEYAKEIWDIDQIKI